MSTDVLADLARRATAVYNQQLRSRLETEAKGQFVAIEPDSGDFFLGATLSEAIGASRKAYPNKLAYGMRVGQSAAVKIGVKM
jgi:hypothetical protein